jgi:hypothetical protein
MGWARRVGFGEPSGPALPSNVIQHGIFWFNGRSFKKTF